MRRILSATPNVLTATRVLLAVLFPFVSRQSQLAILLAAMATEYLDGAVARRFGWESDFGRIFDPIADKILFGFVAGTLLVEGRLTWIQLLAMGVRDIVVVLSSIGLALRGRAVRVLSMKPGVFGKVTTAFQYVALISLLAGFGITPVLMVLTFISGLLAAYQYRVNYLHRPAPPHEEAPRAAA